MTKRIATILMMASLLSGCGWITARKVPVQQGNKITQKMVDQVKPGMSPAQVEKIMGPPILMNTFPNGALNYVYTMESDKENVKKHLTFVFKNQKLVQMSGNFTPDN